MTTVFAPGAGAPEICRSFLQAGIGVLIQATLLLVLGLAAGRLLSARGPALRSLIYRATLGAIALSVLFSLRLAGSIPARWSVTLPPTSRSGAGLAGAQMAPVPPQPTGATTPVVPEPILRAAPEARSDPSGAVAARIGEPRASSIGWIYAGAAGVW